MNLKTNAISKENWTLLLQTYAQKHNLDLVVENNDLNYLVLHSSNPSQFSHLLQIIRRYILKKNMFMTVIKRINQKTAILSIG